MEFQQIIVFFLNVILKMKKNKIAGKIFTLILILNKNVIIEDVAMKKLIIIIIITIIMVYLGVIIKQLFQ